MRERDPIAEALNNISHRLEEGNYPQRFKFEYSTKEDAELALQAPDMFVVLCDINDYCRGQLKHGDINEKEERHLEHIRQLCWSLGLFQ